jgi:hypothetical protein
MTSIGDLRAALALETDRRRRTEAQLARCQRELTKARETINTLTELVASKPGLTEVGVIAQAALLGTGEETLPVAAYSASRLSRETTE